jgi:hypothetical protein
MKNRTITIIAVLLLATRRQKADIYDEKLNSDPLRIFMNTLYDGKNS